MKGGPRKTLTRITFICLVIIECPRFALSQQSAQPSQTTTSRKRDALAFGPIGDTDLERTIKGVRITSKSARQTEVVIDLPILENKEGITLNPRDWLVIRPDARGIVSSTQPFSFDLAVRMPKEVPSDITNGAYNGTVKIRSRDLGAPMELPVEVTITVPEIVLDDRTAKSGLRSEVWCCLPERNHLDVNLRTNSTNPQNVAIYLPPNLEDEQGKSYEEKKLRLSFADPSQAKIVIPPSGAAATHVRLRLDAGDPNLPPGEYHGEVFLDGERVRDRAIPFRVTVRERTFDRIVGVAAILLLIGGAVGLGWSAWRMLRRRPFFQGREVAYEFGESGGSRGFRGQFMILRRQDGRKARYEVESLQRATTRLAGRPVTSSNAALALGKVISCEDDSGPYQLEVTYLDDYAVTLALVESPYSGLRHWLQVAGTALLVLASIVLAWRPELVCRALGH